MPQAHRLLRRLRGICTAQHALPRGDPWKSTNGDFQEQNRWQRAAKRKERLGEGTGSVISKVQQAHSPSSTSDC